MTTEIKQDVTTTTNTIEISITSLEQLTKHIDDKFNTLTKSIDSWDTRFNDISLVCEAIKQQTKNDLLYPNDIKQVGDRNSKNKTISTSKEEKLYGANFITYGKMNDESDEDHKNDSSSDEEDENISDSSSSSLSKEDYSSSAKRNLKKKKNNKTKKKRGCCYLFWKNTCCCCC